MNSSGEIRVEQLLDRPQETPCVLALYRRESQTLGFMPEGAFEQYRDRRQLLIAMDGTRCVGYAMFRVSRRECTAALAHLCVDPNYRGKGISRALFAGVRRETEFCDGVRVKCRRDYEINRIWPKLGFRHVGESRGRSDTGHLLDTWWFGHRALPLLERMAAMGTGARKRACIDFNVFIDLVGERVDGSRALESKELTTEWAEEQLQVCLTEELANEIARDEDPDRRRERRVSVGAFPVLPSQPDDFEAAHRSILTILGPGVSDREVSDRRQLARAAAARADFFVTRDDELLAVADEVEQLLDVVVLRPAELLRRLHAGIDGADYQPRRFEGSQLRVRHVTGDDEARLCENYLHTDRGERKASFLERLRLVLAAVRTARIIEVTESDTPVLLAAIEVRDRCAEFLMLRLHSHRLAPTAVRQLLMTELSRPEYDIYIVSEHVVCAELGSALTDCGFIEYEGRWLKRGQVAVWGTVTDVKWEGDSGGWLEHRLAARSDQDLANDRRATYALERVLWPEKIRTLDVPAYIVPVQPTWAMHLFDTKLAGSDLFGVPPELAFRLENAYYRSAVPAILGVAPARILWYVSGGIGQVRAASYLDEVRVGKPKTLFREFQRLGVYQWDRVLELAKGDVHRDVMVLRFSGTELFEKPIARRHAVRLLAQHGHKSNNFISPLSVSNGFYFDVYERGRGVATGRQRA